MKKSRFNISYLFILPYATLFIILIILPILVSFLLSFTYFNTIEPPEFVGFRHYINLITQDIDFMQYALPNTVKYALIVGPVGYMLAFILAWILSQLTHLLRTIFAIILYSPSLTGGVLMGVVWKVIFSGDRRGYLNFILLRLEIINAPIQFVQQPQIIFVVMVFIGLWSSMGVGFLAMLAGILNINKELYEAAYIDGLKSRWQEIFYITIPSMKPQMLFGAVMALVSTFNTIGIASSLSGATPPPQYAGWLIVDHMNDYGFARFEMGYASAISVFLLLFVLLFNQIARVLFYEKT